MAPAEAPGPTSGAKRTGDLTTRVISALVLAPPILAAAWFGGIAFDLVILLAAVLAVREWVRLVEVRADGAPFLVSAAAVLMVLVCHLAFGAVAALLAGVLAFAALALLGPSVGSTHRLLLAGSVPYVALSMLALMWLRNGTGEDGRALFLFLLLAVWATDIGAYAAGRTIGGPKLAPRISPKKTWAGLIGGMISAALVGFGVAMWAGAAHPTLAMLVGAILAVAGQAGDLFESHMKRRRDVKDSGTLIPGHGGLLDRIDGLMLAAPALALFHAAVGGSVSWW